MNRALYVLSIIALIIVIVGALNWLLVGIFSFNLITFITGNLIWLARAIYVLVGIAGIYTLVYLCIAGTGEIRE
ncbi:MAG: DUF378 domain-containing protein [Clostridia bacterium]|nr:DUF378 domain-containing protein [Clostridia bacterium]